MVRPAMPTGLQVPAGSANLCTQSRSATSPKRQPAPMRAVWAGVSMTTAFIFRTSIIRPEHEENPS